MENSQVFLVYLKANLLGGKEVEAFDIIEAETDVEARSRAINYYTSSETDIAVDFGGVLMFPGTVASIKVEVLAALDLHNIYNARWRKLLEQTESVQELFAKSFSQFEENKDCLEYNES